MRIFAATLLVLLASLHLTYAVTWTIIASPLVVEGTNGTTTIVNLNVTRDDPNLQTDIGISTVSTNAPNSANLATDIVALPNVTVSFNNGDYFQIVPLTIVGDAIYELNETFIITLSLDPADTFSNFTMTIVNDDPPPVIFVSAAPTQEGNVGLKNVTMAFNMNRPSELPCTMVWVTQAGTALAQLDFVLKSGVTVFQPFQTFATSFVQIIGDFSDEPSPEVFLIANAGSVNCTIAPNQVVPIVDDDAAPFLNISTTAVIYEGTNAQPIMNFLMTVYPVASGFSITVNFTLNTGASTATNGSDFTLPSNGVVVIPAGSSQSNLWVRVTGDPVWEVDETVALTITGAINANYTGPDPNLVGTILNDDPVPTLSVADAVYVEGSTNTSRPLNITTGAGWTAYPITVSWSLIDGTATAGQDYIAQNGTTVVGGGFGTAVITNVIGDTAPELTNKTFFLVITNFTCATCPFNVTITKPNGTITIIDDDDPILYITGNTVTESAVAVITYTVTIQVAQATDIVFAYDVTGGTATAGSDFTATSGTGTIVAGTRSASFNVSVLTDTESEPTESVVFTISSITSGPGRIGTASGFGYIVDSPSTPLPTLYTYNITVVEGNNGTTLGYVPITLSFSSSRVINVTYATRDESAYSPIDYLTTDGWVAFQPGETSKNITVYVVGDTIEEPSTAFVLRLASVSNANFGNYTAGVIISDDDALITAAVQSDVYEGTPDFNPRFIGLIVIIGIVVIAIIASIVGFFALKRYVS